ncbi:MAG: ArnT family glycosyltransferase [Pirellulaceae bacterium]
MSKSRDKSKLNRRDLPEDPLGNLEGQPALALSPLLKWCVALGVAALLVGYLAIFFSASPTRLPVILYLLVPDELFRQWAEGEWSQTRFLDRLPILLCGSAILLGSYFLGRVFLRVTRFDKGLTNLERTVFSIGIGLQLQSLLTLISGLIAVSIIPVVSVACWLVSAGIVLVLGWLGKLRDQPVSSELHLPKGAERPTPSKWLLATTWSLWIYVGLCSAAIILGAMLPPIDFDVREYHLQVPKEWHETGGVTFLPHNVYGNMPLGAEIHSLTATQLMSWGERPWWWGALVGKLLMASYGPLTALAIYAMGSRFFSPLAGLAAAAIYISSPWVVHVSVNGLNDAVLGYYLLTAAYVLLISPLSVRSVIVAGFLAGAAASCKYTGVVFVMLPLAILVALLSSLYPQRNFVKGLRYAAVFLLIATLSCSLWYGKNWILAGNPTYPLLSSIFGGKTRNAEKNARWAQAHEPPAYTCRNLSESTRHVLWGSDYHDPLAVPLAAIGIAGTALAMRNQRRMGECSARVSHLSLLASLALLLFFLLVWWLCTHRLDRFLVPAISLAAFLAGAGVEFARKNPLRFVVAGLMVVGLTFNLLVAASMMVGDNRWFVSLERLREDEPKNEFEFSRVKSAHQWLNENVKSEEGVLCVADAAVFDLEMPVFYNTCFDDCLLVNWTEGKSVAQRKEELRSRKVAYVYFDPSEYERYTSKGNYGFDPRFSPKLLDELVEQGILKPPLPNAPQQIYPVSP